MNRIAVGSTNPVKLASCSKAFERVFGSIDVKHDDDDDDDEAAPRDPIRFEVSGFLVKSGVADQPSSDAETKRGAVNRAIAAAKACSKTDDSTSYRFAVGLEGGICDEDDNEDTSSKSKEMHCFAWMAVLEIESGKWGFARTASFPLPSCVATLVRGGMELGHADDKIFGRTNAKHRDGTVGILTRGLIDRAAYYEHALVLALVPFVNPALYK